MHNLKLSHYSPALINEIYSVEQEPTCTEVFHTYFLKPRGLWVSVDGEDDWAHWCAGHFSDIARKYHYQIMLASYHYQIMLASNAVIRYVNTVQEIDAFTAEFGLHETKHRHYSIRWDVLSEYFQGIIIAPYLYERRLHPNTGWYYSWDCASGCIWDKNAIENFYLVRTLEGRWDDSG